MPAKNEQPGVTPVELGLAQTIVADILRTSYTGKGLHGVESVSAVLNNLRSRDGVNLILSELTKLTEIDPPKANESLAQVNTRVAIQTREIDEKILRLETISQLNKFLELNPTDRIQFLATVFPQ